MGDVLDKTLRENLRVILVSTRNPLNIGAAARAMSNFGFLNLRLVNPYDVAFQGARSAVGAASLLEAAEVFTSLDDAVADCGLVVGTTAFHGREAVHAMLPLTVAADTMREQLGSVRVALLFGSETHGLSNEDLSRCHWLTHIPTREEHLSMNLGQAVALLLYELSRTDPAGAGTATSALPAPLADTERLTQVLFECLQVSGYLHTGPSAELKLRRAVRRLGLSAEDAPLWMGMMRQILWKLRSNAEGKAGPTSHQDL
ncbi:MAG: RNA methyltransferase [Acidobacteriales bacterium]|nr:RNA methyltransferase [Terriglobales bacterium]